MQTDLKEYAIISHNTDQVAVAKKDIAAGTCWAHEKKLIKINELIKQGLRFALKNIAKGEYVRQYGHPFARSRGIAAGTLIHPGNIENIVPEVELSDYQQPAETKLDQYLSKMTFMGFRRKGGKAGTRNYYLVAPTSMCASEVAFQIASAMDNDEELKRRYPNIDGVVAIPHTEGCGCDSGLQIDRLLKVLKGYILHPNVGGCLVVDLGCEQTNYERVFQYLKDDIDQGSKPVDWLTIQDSGGTRLAIEKGKSAIRLRLPNVDLVKREPLPVADLLVGTECGASDSFSGITANPVIGGAVDKIIYAGGTAILSEATEMVGTFGMLLPRFRTKEVAHKFQRMLEWYEGLANKLGLTLAPNLVPKNIEGGLINNYIKSLGAVMKGGTTVIEDVVDYGATLKCRGLNIMQGPGNDPESVTGIVAGGANIICFSTGKGTITGDAICPVIKISSNEETFNKLPEDMDFDAGRLLSSNTSAADLSDELLDKIIAVASGEKTWSEKWKQRQFQVWTAGKLSL